MLATSNLLIFGGTVSRTQPDRRARILVLSRLLHVIDDEDVQRALRGFKPQPELFLHGGEDRDTVSRCKSDCAWRRLFRCPLEIEIEEAADAGPIKHDAADRSGKTGGECRHGHGMAGQSARPKQPESSTAGVAGGAIDVDLVESGTRSSVPPGHDESIHRTSHDLIVNGQLESIR